MLENKKQTKKPPKKQLETKQFKNEGQNFEREL